MPHPTVIVKRKRALPFHHRHPWVFSGAVHRVEGGPEVGDEVDLMTSDGEFIARGLFNPKSNIKVRLYAWDADAVFDREFWAKRIDAAIHFRNRLFGNERATACRLIFSESDGLSGLTVDRYGDWLLVQFTSLAMWQRREELISILEDRLHPAGIWLRTEKGIRESEGLEAHDGPVKGGRPPQPLVIEGQGLRFNVDVVEGQKTGFYFDQRDNRQAAARYAAGARVLDVFCYSGAFGIAALRAGARDVLSVDVSEKALELAKSNADLNGVGDRMWFQKGEAFRVMEELYENNERFDMVVLDPPKMTRHRAGIAKALRGYHSLNRLAVGLLNPSGILVTCSCSGLVPGDEFVQMLSDVALRSNRAIQILESRGQAADHPVAVHCLETAYLKCFICRVV